ncbi:unnamed protein product, partial [marine sediment metagenome]
MCTGSFRKSLANDRIADGIVAEKREVWRVDGVMPMILRTAGMKPISSIRS